MPKLYDSELRVKESKRDLNTELLESLRDLKSGRVGRVTMLKKGGSIVESGATKARFAAGMSQSKFATMLGVSVCTLQDWEQGRRQSDGAAQSLIAIATQRPDVFREVLSRA
jgi:putative transcriptional regulator